MAATLHITRRSALVALATGAAATALPALATTPSSAIDRFRHHFAGLAAAMDELAADADGWGLQCGRTADSKRLWHNQQLRHGALLDAMRQDDLVIGKVAAE